MSDLVVSYRSRESGHWKSTQSLDAHIMAGMVVR
jgi:hypothetical protein